MYWRGWSSCERTLASILLGQPHIPSYVLTLLCIAASSKEEPIDATMMQMVVAAVANYDVRGFAHDLAMSFRCNLVACMRACWYVLLSELGSALEEGKESTAPICEYNFAYCMHPRPRSYLKCPGRPQFMNRSRGANGFSMARSQWDCSPQSLGSRIECFSGRIFTEVECAGAAAGPTA